MNRRKIILLLLVLLLILSSCAAGMNSMKGVPDREGEIAGFWMGLWHGVSSPVMFILSLFKKSVSVYETHNNGNWYNFGFLFGASIIFGGSSGGATKYKCR